MQQQFAALLQRYMTANGVKRAYVASVAGISYNYLTRLLSGSRHPSDQVICNIAQALHLSSEQTAELLSAAGFAPTAALLAQAQAVETTEDSLPPSLQSPTQAQINRFIQQFYHLAQDVPALLQDSFLEEMRCLLGYARYKYLLSGGASVLDLVSTDASAAFPMSTRISNEQGRLDVIAQLVGELHADSATEPNLPDHPAAEDTLATLDRLLGSLLNGELPTGNYHPQLITQTLDMLRIGAPWEIRRRIAEALPALCRLDSAGALRLIEVLRLDLDEVRGVDIRRRVLEALPALFALSPQSLPTIIRLLQPQPHDDIYVTLALVESCCDIQAHARTLLEQKEHSLVSAEIGKSIQRVLPDIASIQRQVLLYWDAGERESLGFSMALHNLLAAPDTLLISLQEGLSSLEKLVQLVAVRYLERVLPVRPEQALKLYLLVPAIARHKNVRRAVAKALPALLQCFKETALAPRALARSVILMLAEDPDIPIRRAVADHAMQLFAIDREFLLILVQRMHKDTDPAIRHRLRPVALCLAELWLICYAQTAGLVTTTKRGQTQLVTQPFGE